MHDIVSSFNLSAALSLVNYFYLFYFLKFSYIKYPDSIFFLFFWSCSRKNKISVNMVAKDSKSTGSPKVQVGEIDTRAPFQSVKDAVNMFGEGAFSGERPAIRKARPDSAEVSLYDTISYYHGFALL